MRRPRASSIATVLLLACVGMALTGCAEDADDYVESSAGDGAQSAGNDDMNDDSSEPPPEADEECTFSYQNAIKDGGAEIEVWLIFLFPAGSDDIGDDLLGSDILPYGYQLDVSGIPLGTYDTMVVDQDAFYYAEFGVECDGADWTWRVTAGDADGQLDVAGGDRDDLREALAGLNVLSAGSGDR